VGAPNDPMLALESILRHKHDDDLTEARRKTAALTPHLGRTIGAKRSDGATLLAMEVAAVANEPDLATQLLATFANNIMNAAGAYPNASRKLVNVWGYCLVAASPPAIGSTPKPPPKPPSW